MATITSQVAILLLLLLSATKSHRSMPSNHRVVGCNEKDRGTLLIFRKGIIDPFDWLSTWSTEEDCCAWKGVHCDNITGRVSKLDLNLQLLEGEMNFSILELEFLNYLDLSFNEFDVISTPPVYHNVTHASNLHYLDLHGNYLLHMDNLHWLSRLSSLKYLNLGGVDLHKETNWLQLVAILPSLSELRLNYCNLDNIRSSLEFVNFTSLVTLDLSENYFNSELPKWLFNLKSGISDLDLQDCSLHGEIPSAMLHLHNLKHLLYLNLSLNSDLHMDNLHWLFPLSSLKYLSLNGIDLHKETDWLQVVAMLPSLLELRMSECNLNNINTFLKYVNFTALVTLDLSYNNFNSELPNRMFNLTKDISYLDLSWSNIHGEIPSSLLNLRTLTYLDLSNNQLKGSTLDWIGQLEHLQQLDLSSNMFCGSIHSTLRNLSSLVSLSIGSNYFSGAISEVTFSNLSSLKDMDLSNSTFAFEFDPEWIPPFQLHTLYLSNTNQGPNFPSWIYTQKSLQELDLSSSGISLANGNKFWTFVGGMSRLLLSNNSMSGDISNITLKSSLLQLDRNNFTGGLPHISPKTSHVDLSHNSFSGSLPHSWQNLEDLMYINLRSNRLSGEVLVHLSNAKYLNIMSLGKNEFFGTIPINMPQNLEVIILRANQFEGNIPAQLFNLSSLLHLDLAHNKLSGSIPQCFYNMTPMITGEGGIYAGFEMDLFTKDEEYEYLFKVARQTVDLSANNLFGEIPLELFWLIQVQTLNLSHNNLTGTIPKTIGGMKNLESLDLSNNKLSGEIPQSMALLTFLGYLNLSCNDFIGQIPTGTQLQSFNASSYIYWESRTMWSSS